jgi:hypothetical protein
LRGVRIWTVEGEGAHEVGHEALKPGLEAAVRGRRRVDIAVIAERGLDAGDRFVGALDPGLDSGIADLF